MPEQILIRDLEEETKKYYIDYAMSVIVGRALPDVRDGLKPVHRRILYAMHELGLSPEKGYRKCARIVGDVLGKYHAHGDNSVYEALVRLAQDFSLRYPLVDSHGNFGSVDGDSPAGMRYTEAKQSKLAVEMLKDINKNTVKFVPNFDDTEVEPEVLPSRFPNLIVNGSEGIAVGMRTAIPTHNLGEVIDGAIELIENPNATVKDLMKYIKAPDFPTGATILNKDIKQIYETGTGKIIMRSKYHIEKVDNKDAIIIDEIPYQINKAKLVEEIDYVSKKHKEKDKKTKVEKEVDAKIPEIVDVRDESDREGMRIVIELKRNSNIDEVLFKLFKFTKCQDNYSVNMLALVEGQPCVLNLQQILYHYLNHQKNIVYKRTEFDLDKAKQRMHILEGLMIAIRNIDEVIAIIRQSKTPSESKIRLVNKYSLSEKQAQSIIDMRLQRLTSFEMEKIQTEYRNLEADIIHLKEILNDGNILLAEIKKELLEIKEKFADKRKTEIIEDDSDKEMEEIIKVDNYNVKYFVTLEGYLKKIPLTSLRNAGEHKLKDGDSILYEMEGQNIDDVLIFTDIGNVYRLKGYNINDNKVGDLGIYLPTTLKLDKYEKIKRVINTRYQDETLLLIYKNGNVARVDIKAYKSTYSVLKNIAKSNLMYVGLYNPTDEVLFISNEGKALIAKLEDMNILKNRPKNGVYGMSIPENYNLEKIIFNPKDNIEIEISTSKTKIIKKISKAYYGGMLGNRGLYVYNCKYNKDMITSIYKYYKS